MRCCPAYAWVELADDGSYGGDAASALASVGIIGRSGDQFGASARFARIELLMRDEDFELLCEKLESLVLGSS